jgi:tetratricopeptide (TPR) repeat protein
LDLLAKNHATVRQRDDALSREIILLVQMGDYDTALDLLENHHFHVWEGGGRIHRVYVDTHLLCGQEYFSDGDYQNALKHYQLALEYPENLEVGKPVRGGGEPRVHYFIGTANEALGDKGKAREHYEKSVEQERDWSELSFYQGISYQKLERKDDASRLFSGLMQFAKERLDATAEMDFFAKFGERQSAVNRRAQAHYLLGLSLLGRGEKEKAKTEFMKALDLDINHLWAKYYLSLL